MVKIAFSGIPLSGKTSLLAEVKKILALKYHVEEAEDIYRRNPFDQDQKGGFISQFFFMTSQINEENIRALANPDLLLCDRSVLDQWVHWQKYVSSKPSDQKLEEKNRLLKQIYQFWIRTYQLIFNIRFDIQALSTRMAPQPVLPFGSDEIKALDEIIIKCIQRDQIKTVEIWNNQTIDDGAQQIVSQISAHKFI